MNKKKYLNKYLLSILVIIILFISSILIINEIEYNKYKRNLNYKISSIINEVNNKYENIDKNDIVNILNNNDYKDILKEYGYDINKDSYIHNNDVIKNDYLIYKIIIIIVCFSIILYLFIKSHLDSDKEIDKIITYIDNINHKNYELHIEELNEDKLSILKEEIYKTTIMLKENAINNLNDKINLKNSLEDISHQLKTPLTSINILLDNIIEDTYMDVSIREEFIRQIKREITNINFLVLNILKLSKFETNTIDFNRDNILVKDLINESIKNVSNLCDLKNISIIFNNNCINRIYCDFLWQVEAITNIVKNAIEYSKNNSKIIIECSDNNLYTEIKIIDFGDGLDKEELNNIFKRFYKGNNASRDSFGIGLSLAKEIISKDNGKIYVESIKGEKTIFTIKYFYSNFIV